MKCVCVCVCVCVFQFTSFSSNVNYALSLHKITKCWQELNYNFFQWNKVWKFALFNKTVNKQAVM